MNQEKRVVTVHMWINTCETNYVKKFYNEDYLCHVPESGYRSAWAVWLRLKIQILLTIFCKFFQLS